MYNGGISIAFAWCDYLDLAEELGGSSDNEAKLRSSISRAYYAAYCHVRNYMINNDHNEIPRDRSVHDYVIKYFWGFEQRSIKTRKRRELAIELDRLKNRRVDADYKNIHPKGNLVMLNSETKTALIESRRILSIIDAGGV